MIPVPDLSEPLQIRQCPSSVTSPIISCPGCILHPSIPFSDPCLRTEKEPTQVQGLDRNVTLLLVSSFRKRVQDRLGVSFGTPRTSLATWKLGFRLVQRCGTDPKDGKSPRPQVVPTSLLLSSFFSPLPLVPQTFGVLDHSSPLSFLVVLGACEVKDEQEGRSKNLLLELHYSLLLKGSMIVFPHILLSSIPYFRSRLFFVEMTT